MEVGLHAENLEEDEQGEGIDVHLVDAAIDDEIAQDAEKDQGINAAGREGERQRAGWLRAWSS
jgi:hypothetical protein